MGGRQLIETPRRLVGARDWVDWAEACTICLEVDLAVEWEDQADMALAWEVGEGNSCLQRRHGTAVVVAAGVAAGAAGAEEGDSWD